LLVLVVGDIVKYLALMLFQGLLNILRRYLFEQGSLTLADLP
jgi:hypothetical protein